WREAESKPSRRAAESSRVEKKSGPQDSRVTIPHSPEHIDMDAFFEDISANNVPTPPTQTTGPQPAQTTGPNNEFEELLSRSTQKLYPGCDMTTLEFTTEISHIKALHKITDAGFNKILALLQKACPPSKGYNFPSSYYEIKKTYKKIGLGYESIHACINDCFLFWGSEDNLKMPNCPICKASRWKDPKKTKGKKVANKVVRYFPLTPRLQRMFNTKHIAKWMTWHATGQSKENGKMNHPCDESKNYGKEFDEDAVEYSFPNESGGGPLRYRWMFPFERYMKKLKNYVRNKAKPEGSIAEGYVAEEALTFCSRYLKDDVETRFNRLGRNDDGLPEEEPDKFQVFWSVCKPTGRMKETRLTIDVM
ncbi:hypothetical protein Tco_1392922, partial [Tanacetum coccineum]